MTAHRLARGSDQPLRPRTPGERIRETLELPEAADGPALERVLSLLIDRLLARRERRGRSLRSVVLSAALVEQGGTWRQSLSFREALADPQRMRLVLTPRLQMLPAPAQSLSLTVERFGPAGGDQRALLEDAETSVPDGCARRSARRGSRPDLRRRCGSWRSIPTPDSRSARSMLTPFEG